MLLSWIKGFETVSLGIEKEKVLDTMTSIHMISTFVNVINAGLVVTSADGVC